MSHSHISGEGWKQPATTAQTWTEEWSRSRIIWVPKRRGGITALEIQDLKPVERGADLLIVTTKGKRFYVQFMVGRTFYPLDLPLLVWPADRGDSGAFWVMPA